MGHAGRAIPEEASLAARYLSKVFQHLSRLTRA